MEQREFFFKYDGVCFICVAPDLKEARNLLRSRFSSKQTKNMELFHMDKSWPEWIFEHPGTYHLYDTEGSGGFWKT